MPNFVPSTASTAELAHGEKSCTQSLTHSASLFDAPVTEALPSASLVTSQSILDHICLPTVAYSSWANRCPRPLVHI